MSEKMSKLSSKLRILAAVALISACGTQTTSSESSTLIGYRYGVKLVRAVDEVSWVEVKGTMEFWFFSAPVFRQINSDYVEPQFYGDSQACNGSGSGSYTVASIGGDERQLTVSLAYDGTRDLRGLCRMTDRALTVTLQPSGSVDVLDGKRVVRMERVEKIQ